MITILPKVALQLLITLALLMSALAFASDSGSDQDDYVMQLRWQHQAQFTGFYIAKAKRFYDNENLNVILKAGGVGIEPLKELDTGRADSIVEWLPVVLESKSQRNQLVNIAQLFQTSGLMLTCLRTNQIFSKSDLKGKRIGVWGGSLEIPFRKWMDFLDISTNGGEDGVTIVPQDETIDLLLDKEVDCISTMNYNEYWLLLDRVDPFDLITFRYHDLGFGLLEDGIYIKKDCLLNADCADRSTRFLRASLKGWKYAVENPEEAIQIVTAFINRNKENNLTNDEVRHQDLMMKEILKTIVNEDKEGIGLLNIPDFLQTEALMGDSAALSDFSHQNWTDKIYNIATNNSHSLASRKTLFLFNQIVDSIWFYIIDIIGTIAFGTAGFLRAQERHYNIYGAVVLTSLPAVAGGTIRDILIGGERLPPFVFNDPIYLYIIFTIVIFGSLAVYFISPNIASKKHFNLLLNISDAIGLSFFAIVGAKVAISAELHWMWIPICSTLTCVGGGILMDVCTGQEPNNFKGVLYEEFAALSGMLMVIQMYFANYLDNPTIYLIISTSVILVSIIALRLWAVKNNYHSFRLRLRKEKIKKRRSLLRKYNREQRKE